MAKWSRAWNPYLFSIRVEVWNLQGILDFFPVFPKFKGKYLLSAMFSDIEILNINKVGSKLVLQCSKSHVVFYGLLLFLCTKIGNFREKTLRILLFLAIDCLKFPMIWFLIHRGALKGLFGAFSGKKFKNLLLNFWGGQPHCAIWDL